MLRIADEDTWFLGTVKAKVISSTERSRVLFIFIIDMKRVIFTLIQLNEDEGIMINLRPFARIPKHRQFNFIPRFYEPEKEAYREIREKHNNNSLNMESSSGMRVKFQSNRDKRLNNTRSQNRRILVIFALLIFICYLLVTI